MSSARVRTAAPEDAAALGGLAQSLSTLPLLGRYSVSASGLHTELLRLLTEQAEPAPSERLLVIERHAAGPDAAGVAAGVTAGAAAGVKELCGLARFSLRGQLGRGGYLRLIALAPGTHGQGLGRLLLDEVERQVAQCSPELFLLTSDFNAPAQRFYERRGYTRVGALADYVRTGITELLYWKRLR